MYITEKTTVQEILEARPDAAAVFLQHGVDVSMECDESIQGCDLSLGCESMCHIDNIDALINDLQKLFNTALQPTKS
jgi:hypothetical protein